MKIGIVSNSRLGTSLGVRLAATGHEITFWSRRDRIMVLGGFDDMIDQDRISVVGGSELKGWADVTIFAVPWDEREDLFDVIPTSGVLVDPMNAPDVRGSSELLQTELPRLQVVKAFNTAPWTAVFEPARRLGLPIASDHREAADVVSRLAAEINYEPLPLGRLRHGRLFEPGGPLHGEYHSDALPSLFA